MSSSETSSTPDANCQDLPRDPGHNTSESSAEQINVGRVIRAHGLNGQLRVKSLSDVAQRYQPGGVVYINGTPFTITASGFFRHGQILLTLQGIEDSNAAQKLVEQWITVPVEAAPPLPEGEWFHFQLLGLRVITDQGEDLGKITDILETGSNDVYVVSGVKTEILIPALKTVITQVRLDEGVMLVSLPDGLR